MMALECGLAVETAVDAILTIDDQGILDSCHAATERKARRLARRHPARSSRLAYA